MEQAENAHPFRIVVTGPFQSGRSSLVNALIGGDVLAAQPVPTTAAVQLVRFGRRERALLWFHSPMTTQDLSALPPGLRAAVAESGGALPCVELPLREAVSHVVYPGWEVNRLLGRTPPGLGRAWRCPFSRLELALPLPVLRGGLELEETPALETPEGEQALRRDLPGAGAVVLTLPAARPGHGAARSFLSSLWPRFGGRPLFCALTQADRLKTERERTLARELASSLLPPGTPVFLCCTRTAGEDPELGGLRAALLGAAGVREEQTSRAGGSAGAEEPFALVRELAGRYRERFPEETAGLLKQAQAAEARLRDERPVLAVAGEFSSGKSSLLNALLGYPLLETDALPDTTTCAVSLQESTGFHLAQAGGRPVSASSWAELAGLLRRAAAQGAGKPAAVGCPAPFLRGLRVLDTPGVGSRAEAHGGLTARILREEADGCLVVCSAERPMPESLCRFLEETLGELLPFTAFAVTKIDLIRPAWRARQAAYVRDVLISRFSLPDPLVLPVSALEKGGAEKTAAMLLRFWASRRQAMLACRRRRAVRPLLVPLQDLLRRARPAEPSQAQADEALRRLARALQEQEDALD